MELSEAGGYRASNHRREEQGRHDGAEGDERRDDTSTPTQGFEQKDGCRQIDRQNDKRDEEIDPCADPADRGAESSLKPPPNECFHQLMAGEQKRQRCQRSILGALVDVADHIDTDCSDEQPANQISLRRKAHDPTVTGCVTTAGVSAGVTIGHREGDHWPGRSPGNRMMLKAKAHRATTEGWDHERSRIIPKRPSKVSLAQR